MRLIFWLVVVALIIGLVGTCLFVVDQTQFVIVKRFGDPVRTLIEPGLRLKYPWPIDTLVRFDNRLMVLENPAPGEPENSATRLAYAYNQRAVSYVYGETWDDGEDPTITYAREFRYDEARQRYLNREVDPTTASWERLVGGQEIWSDYDGDEIYGGFTIDGGGVVTDVRSFELGIGTFAWVDDVPDNDSVWYYHGDQIGTTRLMTTRGG